MHVTIYEVRQWLYTKRSTYLWNCHPNFIQLWRLLHKKIGTDYSDVLLKAIALLELAVEAKEQDMEMKVVEKDKNLALKSE